LAVGNKLDQIEKNTFEELKSKAIEISKQLANFIKYLKRSEIQ